MTEPTDRLKIREIGTTEWVKKWTNVNGEWIDAGILQDAKIGEGNSGFEFYKDEKLEYQHALMKSHISFLEYVTKNFFQTYGHMKREVWQKRQEKAGAMLDPTEFTTEQIYDLWQEKSREK